LIIVDDCSTDRTLEIIKQFEILDSRIRVFVNDFNLGDYKNRNRAASVASGQFLKYVDADDIIYSHGLEVMVNCMVDYPNAALGIQSVNREDITPYPILVEPRQSFVEHFLNGGLFLSGPTGVIINRDIFESEGGFSGKRYVGDTELWLRLGLTYPIVKFQPALIWWRSHDDQEIKKENLSFKPVLDRYLMDKSFLFCKKCPLSQEELKLAYMKLNRRYLNNLLVKLLVKGKFLFFVNYILKSKMSFKDLCLAIFH
jgi:glycosyltransferase involved in cell wall biosynthesis